MARAWWCLTDVLHGAPAGREEAGSAWIWVARNSASIQQNDAHSSIPSQHTSDAAPEDSDVEQTSQEEERPRGHFIWLATS